MTDKQFTESEQKNSCHYTISRRPNELGPGWILKLFEGGVEVGGGVFPADDEIGTRTAMRNAYHDAENEGNMWLESR